MWEPLQRRSRGSGPATEGIPKVMPVEQCHTGRQESLTLHERLFEPAISS
jgi:hypothetical protein